MRINTNLTAMNTFNQVTKNQNKISSAVGQLSSGSAINSAADNAAGLAISEKMRAQIRGLDKASSNAQDAVSLVQTADGALSQSTTILQRMRELAVQSSSDTNQNEIDRSALQDEFSQLQSELNDISKNTTFNKKNLLDGSLAKTKNNLTNTSLSNSGLTVQLGKANAGDYNFSVSTKLESAAVDGKKATSVDLVTNGATSYFTNASVTNQATLGTNAAESSLLNGNYTLSAKYGSDKNITVTATGDNGQTFTATVNNADLQNLATASGANLKIDMVFNADKNDAFKVSVGLASNIMANDTNFGTLADNVSKMTVSVAGGVTAQAAQYGAYANLTGASSVKLESGMSSVSFDNGVKVSFNTLTASAVDTTNKASISDLTAAANPTDANTLAAVNTAGGTLQGTVTGATTTLSAAATSKLAEGDYSISSDASGALTLTDAKGTKYTAAAQSTIVAAGAGSQTLTYQFKDTAGATAFTADLALTYSGAQTAGAVSFNGTMTGTNGYAMTNNTANTGAMLSNFKFTDDSVVSDGGLTMKAADDGTTTTFTAKDANGTSYTASILDSAMASGASSGEVKNTLTFTSTGTDKASGFTVDLSTTNNGATGVTFTNNSTVLSNPLTVGFAGHNYDTLFGAGSASGQSAITTALKSATFFSNGTSTGSWNSFTTNNTSNVAAGAMTITADNNGAGSGTFGGTVTFTAKDASGRNFTASGVSSTLYANGSATTTQLTFTDSSDPANTFKLSLSTSAGGAATYIKDDTVGTTIKVSNNLTKSTTSTFSVEQTANAGLTFQVGANQGDTMTINVDRLDANYLGVASASVATQSAAEAAVKTVDSAINQVSAQRAYLGAIQNRLEDKINNLSTSSENLTSAESQIRDVDMAKKMTDFTNANILSQASTAMLAQANSLPQSVLSLIGK